MIGRIQKLKNKKGFTLVELIVVIAIIAILTAVIVPLIARYSAQAQYTTLQDAASTISNSANSALSDGNQVSAVNINYITGVKSADGKLTISLYKTGSSTPVSTVTSNTDGTLPSTGASGSKGEQRACERLCTSLATTLPNTCAFYISVNASAVAGVAYTNAATTLSSGDVSHADGFDDAYELGGSAVGVSGKYIPGEEKTAKASFDGSVGKVEDAA